VGQSNGHRCHRRTVTRQNRPAGCAVHMDETSFAANERKYDKLSSDLVPPSPLPRMPSACGGYINGDDGGTQGLTALCDGRRSLWQLRGSVWIEIKTDFVPDGMSATSNCIFAVSNRSVWRKCVTPPTPAIKPTAIKVESPNQAVVTSTPKIQDTKQREPGCGYRGR